MAANSERTNPCWTRLLTHILAAPPYSLAGAGAEPLHFQFPVGWVRAWQSAPKVIQSFPLRPSERLAGYFHRDLARGFHKASDHTVFNTSPQEGIVCFPHEEE